MFNFFQGKGGNPSQNPSMADREVECEQFIGDDSELYCRNKDKTLVTMLTRKNIGMYLQFVLFGIGSVLPIFVIFAAVDYFDDIFPHRQPEFAMNAIYNPLLFCGCFVNLVWGRAASFKWRIVSGFSVVVICMLGFIFLDQLELCGSTCLRSHYWSVLFLAGILGLVDAVCQSTLFGLTTHALPPIYTHGLMLTGDTARITKKVAKTALKQLLATKQLLNKAWCRLMWSPYDVFKSFDEDCYQKSSCVELLLLWDSSHIYFGSGRCLLSSH